jgi:hypothetical protein
MVQFTTLKQLLQENSLDFLALRLFIQTHANLSKQDASTIVDWYRFTDAHDAIDNEPALQGYPMPCLVDPDVWNHLTDWAIEAYFKQSGKSLYDLVSSRNPLPRLVKNVLKKEFEKVGQRKLQNEGMHEPMLDLTFMLAIRRILNCTKEQAHQIILWMRGVKDWEDLSPDTQEPILDKWNPDLVNELRHPGMSYSDYVMDEIASMLQTKYNLDARELI